MECSRCPEPALSSSRERSSSSSSSQRRSAAASGAAFAGGELVHFGPLRRWRLALLGCAVLSVAVAAQEDSASKPPAYLEDDFCTSQHQAGSEADRQTEISIGSMTCEKLMEFVYISRKKVWEQLDGQLAAANGTAVAGGGEPPRGVVAFLLSTSLASSLLSAHAHIIVAVASQRAECFSEHVRLLLTVSLRRMKSLATGQVNQLWLAGQSGFVGQEQEADMAKRLTAWLSEAATLLDTDLRTMKTVLSSWKPPTADEARFYSHEADGRYSTMETLRRDTFEEWQMDKGLVQGLLRHVLPVDAVVADFGAGSGHYSRWLNDTGLVSAHAFDGSPDIGLVTRGVVASADLGKPLSLGRKFDWTLCLEVAEHIPADLTATFLQNLEAHTSDGLVISWARPGLQGLGSANPLSQTQVLALLREHTGLIHLDEDLTRKVRASSTLSHLAESILVMVRSQRPGSEVGELTGVADVAPGCAAEEGWIYAGNDVQMFSAVSSAAACSELCNSNDQCKFWTWSRDDGHKELCWIKATREYRIAHAGFISGTKDASA